VTAKQFLDFLKHYGWSGAFLYKSIDLEVVTVGNFRHPGEQQNRNVRLNPLHHSRYFAAVGLGHRVIEHNQVHWEGGKQLQSFLSAVGSRHRIASALQIKTPPGSGSRVVIDTE